MYKFILLIKNYICPIQENSIWKPIDKDDYYYCVKYSKWFNHGVLYPIITFYKLDMSSEPKKLFYLDRYSFCKYMKKINDE